MFKQQTYETRVVNDILYINCSSDISLTKRGIKKEDPEPNVTSTDSQSQEKSSDENESDELSVNYWANKILATADPKEKAHLTDLAAEKWFKDELKIIRSNLLTPDQPARSETLNIIDPGKIRRGKGGTIVSELYCCLLS